MQNIARQYRQAFLPNIPPRLQINDASLIWGGLFDYNGTWAAPHSEHMHGADVDVDKYSIPGGNRDEFEEIVRRNHGDPQKHPDPTNWTHYHIDFGD